MTLPGGLAARLTAAFLLVTLVAVGSVALLARRSGGDDFRDYVASQMPGRAGPSAAGQVPGTARGLGPAPGAGLAPGGPMRGPAAMVASAEEEFLRRLDQSLVTAAGIAGAAALLVGIVAASRLTRPLRSLQAAAQRMGQGDLGARVPLLGSGELVALARTFNHMAESLERQETARRALVADVAHDLRTPVTVIQGTIDALLDGVYEPTAERLSSIRQETTRLAQLVRDLRDVSLSDAGQLRLDLRPVAVGELAERARRRLEAVAGARGIRLQSVAHTATPLIEADPARLEQALDNLLGNALRHTPPGGEVTIHTLPTGPAGARQVAIAVADTGSGLAPEDLPRVFDRFYRADPARARYEDDGSAGSGLGLAIVKAIVEAHGGHVRVESVPGSGARFTMAFPAAG